MVMVALPATFAYDLPPSSTTLNQLTAWVGAGLLAVAAGGGSHSTGRPWGMVSSCASVAVLVAIAIWLATYVAAAVWGSGSPALGVIWAVAASSAAAASMVALPTHSAAKSHVPSAAIGTLFSAVATAVLVAGALGATIGVVQVFAPSAIDGTVVSNPTVTGRASGNLRQPNLLATLLLWAAVACVWDASRDSVAPGGARVAITALFVFMLIGVALTASRTGAVGVLLLAIWGVLDRRLPLVSRVQLASAPVAYALAWGLLVAASAITPAGFSGADRLQETGDLSTSRFAVWSNALELIRQSPWIGVGVGEFNFAWTLTQFSRPRPSAFFDHTHNLPLQLVVELGIPLGLLVLGLLLYALWRAFVAARNTSGDAGLAKRCAFVMVLLIGVHSLLEYPLWYAYFLFPTAFLWGLCLAPVEPARQGAAVSASAPPGRRRATRWPAAAGALMLAGSAFAIWDYARVSRIFVASDDAPPLEERIRDGRRSVFFAHHADYAWATTSVAPPLEAFRRPTHFLLDTRLMIAWSKALAAHGDVDRARWLAARLAEFRRPDAAAFFAPCQAPPEPGTARPFQCEPPERRYTFRDFR